ncbi:MAG: PH domain-containing protein [Clostridiales bacterium]|nr:PH domain-containing protein [Clostridiales bacterium]
MAKIDKLTALTEEEDIIWQDRKRYIGLPISFTVYSFSKSKFYLKTGLFNIKREEILLYRVLDITLKQSFGQKIFGVGTIVLSTADKSTPTLEIKSIKQPERISKAISTLVEQRRDEKRVTGKEMFGASGAFGHGDVDGIDHDGDGHFDLDDLIDHH